MCINLFTKMDSEATAISVQHARDLVKLVDETPERTELEPNFHLYLMFFFIFHSDYFITPSILLF